MSRPHIIGLCGYAGAGKDTAADFLVRYAGFTKLAFADALREEVAAAFELTPVEQASLFSPEQKNRPTERLALARCARGIGYIGALALHTAATVDSAWLAHRRSPRYIMQTWGTEYRRTIDDAYWTRALARRIHGLSQCGYARFVVPDCRFANEATSLRAMGGVLWHIQRAGLCAATTPEGAHPSAGDPAALQPTRTLQNDSSRIDLRNATLGAWWAHEAGFQEVLVSISP